MKLLSDVMREGWVTVEHVLDAYLTIGLESTREWSRCVLGAVARACTPAKLHQKVMLRHNYCEVLGGDYSHGFVRGFDIGDLKCISKPDLAPRYLLGLEDGKAARDVPRPERHRSRHLTQRPHHMCTKIRTLRGTQK